MLAVHTFRDYLEAPRGFRVAKARLGELIEFAELLHLQDPDFNEFWRFATAIGALEAIAFASRLCETFGILPELPWGADHSTDEFWNKFPSEIARGWMAPGVEPLDLVVRSTDSLTTLLDAIPSVWRELSPGTDHIETSSANMGAQEMTVRIIRAEVGLLEISISCLLGAYYKDEVSLTVGDECIRVQHDASSGNVRIRVEDEESQIVVPRISAGRMFVRIEIRRDSITSGFVPIVCSAHRFVSPIPDDWGAFLAGPLESSVALLKVSID